MPIDPRIPLMGAPVAQLQSPVEALSALTQLQAVREQTEARRLAAEEARTKLARQRAVDAALQEAITVDPQTGRITIDKQKVMANLPNIGGAAALELQDHLDTKETQANALVESHARVAKLRQELMGTLAHGVVVSGGDPGYWRAALREAKGVGTVSEERYQELAAIDDPAQILTLARGFAAAAGGKTDLQKVTTVNEAGETVEKFVTPTEGATYVQPTKTSPLSYQAKEVLVDGRPVMASFNPQTGTYSVGGQDVTARVRPIPPQGPGPEPLMSIIGPDGKPVYVTRSQALGKTPGTAGGAARPPTEGERKAAGFHGQMHQALSTINQLESKLTASDLYQIQSLPQEGISGAINRGAMSENAKRYIQAFNQFTEARLRPVSGAAISASEYERDRATYGKQYGETRDLAAQRQSARTQALDALRVMAGSAIEEPAARPPGETTSATAPKKKNPFVK